jgi:spermidine/putrescine transport system permease protein
VTALETRRATGSRTPSRRPRGPIRWLRDHIIPIIAVFAFIYLLVPNLVVLIFSFNAPRGRYNLTFDRFSVDAWLHPCGTPGICSSLGLSLKIGLLATLVATILGTMIAFGIVRYRFLGRSSTNLLIFLPMATPEVVMGSSLLTLFVGPLHVVPLGFPAILFAHIMFCISFVVVTVKARLAGLDPRLEQAAMDLYANEFQTFRRITLPLVAPGIAAAALLSFSLSFDDYIITNFNSTASSTTFPLFVWNASTRGTPVQINVIGTLMFIVSLAAVGGAQFVAFRRRKHFAP